MSVELKQQEKYKNMLKRKNKEKKIYKDKNSSLRIEKINLIKCIERKDKEIERLNNIIKIMEKYFELIVDLGYDYDGLNNEESLKKLIDELCRYASLGRAYNTTEAIYVNGDKKYNILNEEILDKGE